MKSVEVKNICKSFDSKEVLKDISFEVLKNEIFVLLGPNGAGKTTTVKILSGVLEPDKGEVYIFGKKMSVSAIEVKQVIGYLPDEPYIYNKLVGREFIEFIMGVYKTQLDVEKYNFLLEQFELKEAINKPIETYSKGMKQKLLLLSIFLRDPEVYIFDEPLIGLDPQSISFFKQYVKKITEEGKTVILCTHILELAEQLADKIAIIYDGKILVCEPKTVLKEKFKNQTLEKIYLSVINNKI
jgi:ABC-2 type transport system ATP-binding protein